jgi:hypothetical protein
VRGRDAEPLPAGGSVARKRDRARPPEDAQVRGRARPPLGAASFLAPAKGPLRLDNFAGLGHAFYLACKETCAPGKTSAPHSLAYGIASEGRNG